jgi:hypothetical protein
MGEKDLLHIHHMAISLVPDSADKTYGGEVCVFLLRNIRILIKHIFHITIIRAFENLCS